MALVRAGQHEPHLVEEEQPRRRHRRDERAQRRARRRRARGEREPEPLGPLAEVVRVRDEAVEEPVGDRVGISSRCAGG